MQSSDSGGVTFFIPCLNEEGNVGRAIDNIVHIMKDVGGSYEILVVDDASADGSVAEVKGRQERYPEAHIKSIQNFITRGLGRNYFIAAQRAREKYFMMVCGDAAEPAETIRAIVSLKGQADAIVPYFGFHEKRTLARRILSRTFTLMVNLISGYRLTYYNGPVLHKTENVRMWFAETAGFGYQAELLCRLLDEGIVVKEIQVSNSDRITGATKALKLGNFLSVTNSLFHIGLRRLERFTLRLSGGKTQRRPPHLYKKVD
jgi:glycosyltransferase involved in cell wall biosynthesis